MQKHKYYTINNKYLAAGLSFLGFHFFKYGKGEETTYGFLDNEKFRKALTGLTSLKNKMKN